MIGDADTLIKTFNRFRSDISDPSAHHENGTFGDLWPDLAHFAVRHVPFANMLYLKGTLDYMLFYHLYEAASPGWWERTNRRLVKEQGRAMTGYTPGGGVPTGVPWLYMQNRQGRVSGWRGRIRKAARLTVVLYRLNGRDERDLALRGDRAALLASVGLLKAMLDDEAPCPGEMPRLRAMLSNLVG